MKITLDISQMTYFAFAVLTRLIRLTQIAALLFLIVSAAAQDSDPCGCNAVVVDGVFNYRAEKGDSEAVKDVRHIIVNSSYEEMQKAFSAGGGGSYAGFGLNANTSRSEFQKRISELKNDDHEYGSSKSARQLLERYGDANVLAAWTKCKSECNASGVRDYIEPQDDNNFVFHIRWVPTTESPFPTVVTSNVAGAKPPDEPGLAPGELVPKGSEIGPNDHFITLFREKTNQPIVISVHLKGANRDVAEYWPKVIPALAAPKPEPTAIGQQVNQSCNGNSAKCDQIWTIRAPEQGRLTIELTVSNNHCAPIRLYYLINGEKVQDTHRDFGYSPTHDGQNAKDGPLTNTVDLGEVKKGDRIGLEAEVLAGGCAGNPPHLHNWQGNLRLSIRP